MLLVSERVLVAREVPFPYDHFLLEASGPVEGKVVIDAGSNAVHGIDAAAVSRYFNAPVVIAADVAGYPLRKKIFRLMDNLRAGDTLLLPLEWDFYSSGEVLSENFVTRVANEQRQLAHYVAELPFLEKMRFVLLEYPVKHVFEAVWANRTADPGNRSELDRLRRYETRFGRNDNSSYGGALRDGPEKMDFIAAWAGSCDRYLFIRKDELRMAVSEGFLEGLALLERLRDRGVAIYFTWPAVVDSEKSTCYSNPRITGGLPAYARQIRSAVEASGFQMLGDYRDSHLPADCFLNTYYHVRWSCSHRRTEALLGALSAGQVGPLDRPAGLTDLQSSFRRYLEAKRRALSP
ncbi:MAG: hypothetical protein R3228_09755 [Halioglobus sp.]|nr:hypothetical protein [Halioglobus sp.]